MNAPSSSASEKTAPTNGFIRALVILAAIACTILVLWMLWKSQIDPYVNQTLKLKGSKENGSQLFRMNCAGCHGINAQGLVGPDLQEVTKHQRDAQLVHQITSGQTPPMPSFQMEPQAMADLLSYLHTIN